MSECEHPLLTESNWCPECGYITEDEDECNEDPECDWSFNQCRYDGDTILLPHVGLMNDGNNLFLPF